jgi:hypothetical protein
MQQHSQHLSQQSTPVVGPSDLSAAAVQLLSVRIMLEAIGSHTYAVKLTGNDFKGLQQ